MEKTRQYNCEDCPFQGENGLELKKHIIITKHHPSEYKEKCYTCKKDFSSYWHLMNHRKSEHPSSKKCRYFLSEKCMFDAKSCWYRHGIESSEELSGSRSADVACNQCENVFTSKTDLMKHLKADHKSKVAKCRNYAQGNCSLTEMSCWFLHEKQKVKNDIEDHIGNVHETEVNEQVFQNAQEKTPPDQIIKIMNLIEKLSIQVEKLEKNVMNSH